MFGVWCLAFCFAQSSQRSKDAKGIRNKKLKIRNKEMKLLLFKIPNLLNTLNVLNLLFLPNTKVFFDTKAQSHQVTKIFKTKKHIYLENTSNLLNTLNVLNLLNLSTLSNTKDFFDTKSQSFCFRAKLAKEQGTQKQVNQF
jgi:hypothetical protein